MMRYQPNPILLGDAALAVAANATATISRDFAYTAEIGEAGLRIEVELDYTHSAASTLKLQHGVQMSDGTTRWDDVGAGASKALSASVAAATDGPKALTLFPTVSADSAVLPLRSRLRVVLATGAGSTATIKAVTAYVPELARSSAGTTTARSI